MSAYVRLHPAYAPYISCIMHMHHGAYAGSECIYTYIYRVQSECMYSYLSDWRYGISREVLDRF